MWRSIGFFSGLSRRSGTLGFSPSTVLGCSPAPAGFLANPESSFLNSFLPVSSCVEEAGRCSTIGL